MNQMTPEEKLIHDQLYVPAFIEKCAARGVSIPDEETLDSALQLAEGLHRHIQQESRNEVKTAFASFQRATGADKMAHQKQANARITDVSKVAAQNTNLRAALLRASSNR